MDSPFLCAKEYSLPQPFYSEKMILFFFFSELLFNNDVFQSFGILRYF